MKFDPRKKPRHLILVLGDQLDPQSSAFDGFDAKQDAVWMAEVKEEATHVWSHQARITLFLSAMRHFCDSLSESGLVVHYCKLDDPENLGSLENELTATSRRLSPEKLILTEPGDWRVEQNLQTTAQILGLPLEIRPDRHFICSREEFSAHVKGRKQLRMEFFYREMRRKSGILMKNGEPWGGEWNYDKENRESFGRDGPGLLPRPLTFKPNKTTREVIQLVREYFPKHPGNLETFDWPVTPSEADKALEDFIANRLPLFGTYEDAMWAGQTVLYHSRISSALNLKLIDPLKVIAAAEQAFHCHQAPLAAVEGFIRQILGWREYVRGVYWHFMPSYLDLNALSATAPLPPFYWTGQTEMNCLREVISQTLEVGYAHHIQRLMVTGLFALLLGVKPQAVHSWYLAVYVDAVEWVELPNTLGMSQFGDGGIMASKPYVATGRYIERMSNYCSGCRYDPTQRVGPKACPFTTLYWDFLLRHEKLLSKNQRMAMQLKNLARLNEEEKKAIRMQAEDVKCQCGSLNPSAA
jgi:deoxyribodipyrimidine photolyase-related protein